MIAEIPVPEPFIQFALVGTSSGFMEVQSNVDIIKARENGQFVWVHLDGNQKGARKWLEEKLGLSVYCIRPLLEKHVEARFTQMEGGSLLIVRGPNSPKEPDASDLRSVRMWLSNNTLVTVSLRTIPAVEETFEDIQTADTSNNTTIALLILRRCLAPLQSFVQELMEDTDSAEDRLLGPGENPKDTELVETSRQAIYLRRHLTPMRAAITEFLQFPPSKLEAGEEDRWRAKESQLRVMVEDIDLIRDRVAIIRSHMEALDSRELNKRLYIFSVIALIFLPLSFITGLFGINVGGVFWADNPYGFTYFCAGIGVATTALVGLLRWLHWL